MPQKLNSQQVEPIAIVGIGCRFPGAHGPEAFWELLRSGRSAVRDVPRHRVELGYDIDRFFDPRPRIPGKISSGLAGYLDHPEMFDPIPFGLSPRDAIGMEPQQRLAVEIVWDALEDAGIVPESLKGERVAVIFGHMAEDYSRERIAVLGEDAVQHSLDVFSVGGISRAVLSGRISFLLGVTGPSYALDTACSSSLIATHLACQSLWNGESKMALAGGLNVFLSPEGTIALSRSGMLANDGKCKAFDAEANGFVRAEGAGVVVLKPLRDAVADGNPIYAVIRGSGISTDGRDGGHMMAPGRFGQAQAMHDAYARAGIEPSQVHYVEAHGTGTSIGDPIEIGALADVMGPGRAQDRPLLVASVKGNIGHAESASGIAGLIKTALAISHRELPAQLHFKTPSPAIPWDDIPVRVHAEHSAWPYPGLPLAAVNSFGLSGTNAHLVLEGAPERAHETRADAGIADESAPRLFALSAHTPRALEETVRRVCDHLGKIEDESLDDFGFTLGRCRTHRSCRLAVVAASRDELANELRGFLDGEAGSAVSSAETAGSRHAPLVFTFPGQGSQWVGMGRDLLAREPAFRNEIEVWDDIFRAQMHRDPGLRDTKLRDNKLLDNKLLDNKDWSLLEVLAAPETSGVLQRADILQPVLVAFSVALAELWAHYGVKPDMVIGQSLGEIAAACVAGCLSREDAARIACHRGAQVMRVSGRGAMGVVALPAQEVESELERHRGRVSVAGANDPTTTVVAGDTDSVRLFLEELTGRGVFARPLNVDFASHCNHMDPLLEDFGHAIGRVDAREGDVPFYSTAVGGRVAGRELDEAYWVRNMRAPVQLVAATRAVLAAGGEVFLEISPHPVTTRSIEATAACDGDHVVSIPSLRREADEQVSLFGSLGRLHTLGVPVDFSALYPRGRVVPTPLYAYQRRPYWFGTRRRSDLRRPIHPLLGVGLRSSADARRMFWETTLDADAAARLPKIWVDGVHVVPASALVELAFTALRDAWGDASVTLADVRFASVLEVPEDAGRTLQVALDATPTHGGEIRISSTDRNAEDPAWTLHVAALIQVKNEVTLVTSPGETSQERLSPGAELPVASHRVDSLRDRCTEAGSAADYYRGLEAAGVECRAGYRTIAELWHGEREALARIILPESAEAEADQRGAHPGLLEGCFQLLGAALAHGNTETSLSIRPTRAAEVQLSGALAGEVWCHLQLRAGEHGRSSGGEADLVLLRSSGEVVGRIPGLRVEVLAGDAKTAGGERHLYGVDWKRLEAPTTASDPSRADRWLIFAERGDEARSLIAELERRGHHCTVVRTGNAFRRIADVSNGSGVLNEIEVDPTSAGDFRALAEHTIGESPSDRWNVAFLWGMMNTGRGASGQSAGGIVREVCASLEFLASALASVGGARATLHVITRGLHSVVDGDAAPNRADLELGAALFSVGGALEAEYPELTCMRIDLSRAFSAQECALLAEGSRVGGRESQLAVRGDAWFAARLVACADASSGKRRRESDWIPAGDRPFRARVLEPEKLDSVVMLEFERSVPGPDDIEIEVRAAGLCGVDILSSFGMGACFESGREDLGVECAGVVTAVGAGVSKFVPGDEVFGFAPGALSSHVITRACFVARKPAHIGFEDAAAIPLAQGLARFALRDVAGLRAGERVFIHAAAGGVGLAAVKIAQRSGAEVLASAGSEEKRGYLRALGIDCVVDSRSPSSESCTSGSPGSGSHDSTSRGLRTPDWSTAISDATGGAGVDVVLGAFGGEAADEASRMLAPGGRFVDIGSAVRGSEQGRGVRVGRNAAYASVDLLHMAETRPERLAALLREIADEAERGELPVVPSEVFAISQAGRAMRYLAQARHIGKVVLGFDDRRDVPIRPLDRAGPRFSEGSVHLVTGGAEGVGAAIAHWLIERGARTLVLAAGRALSERERNEIERLLREGAEIHVLQADLALPSEVSALLEKVDSLGVPLGAVVHAGGLVESSGPASRTAALSAEIAAVSNLHSITAERKLDVFVLLSSAAPLLGTPDTGAGLASAGVYCDGLARLRRSMGLPVISIHAHGEALPIAQVLRVWDRIFAGGLSEVVVLPPDRERWPLSDRAKASALFDALVEDDVAAADAGASGASGALGKELRELPAEARAKRLHAFVTGRLAAVLKLSAQDRARVDPDLPLNSMGLDSLMALELNFGLEAELGFGVPQASLLRGPSVNDLTKALLERLLEEPPE